MFAVALEEIGLERLGTGDVEQSRGKGHLAQEGGRLAEKLGLPFVGRFIWHLLVSIVGQRIAIDHLHPPLAVEDDEILVGRGGEVVYIWL